MKLPNLNHNMLRKSQRGVSLVELMVALTVGMFIIAAIGYVYLAANNASRSMEASSRIQENMRYAFERMSYDVRMAGMSGCTMQTQVNVLKNSSSWEFDVFSFPLRGYEENAGSLPTGVSGVLRGDVFSVLGVDNSVEYIIESHNPVSAQFELSEKHNIKQGEILVATDCKHAAVFQMTNVNNNDEIKNVVHNTGNSTSPGNCTKGFGLPLNCDDANGNSYTFPPGSRLLRLNAATYYIGTNGTGESALFRQTLGINATTSAIELVEGIENMQILYGVDTSNPADGAVNIYVTADQVVATSLEATAQAAWQRVLAVRVSMVAVSKANELVNTKPQSYVFNGATITPTDRRMRKVFTNTIAVRNRL
ncbi:MAG: PilW family protein [Rhodoferax sp.]|nr:PilW family protein [Rhodoferax sp.]